MTTTAHDEVQLGAQGRLVIPAKLRKALGLKPGDRLIARQEDDRLVLEKAGAIERRLRALFACGWRNLTSVRKTATCQPCAGG